MPPRLIPLILCTGTSCSCKKHATQHFSQIPLSTHKVFDESSRALGDRGWGWRRRNRAVCACMLGLNRVINQIPEKCASRSCRAQLEGKCAPPPLTSPLTSATPQPSSPLGIGGFRGTLELHLSRSSPESRRVQTAEHSAIKRGVNMFYLPNGITHNIYVWPVI